MSENNKRNQVVETGVRVLAVFGFIAIVLIGLWGSVSVARAVPGTLSSLAAAIVSLTSIFVPADEAITISVPSLTVNHNEQFELSWTHENQSVDGSYTFRYDCAPGVSFTSPTRTGSEAAVFCNTPFNFLNASDAIALTAFSDQNRFIDVTVHIDFTPNGASQPTVTGATVLTITNEEQSSSPDATDGTTGGETGGGTPVVTPGEETTDIFVIPNGQTGSNPNGVVDLTASIIEVGVIEKDTGEFTASSTPSRTDDEYRVAIRFAITNIGSRTSDQWTFNAVLPTFPAHIFTSPTQQALGPGDRIEFTLGFDSFVDSDEGEFVINIDPARKINESNKDNNIVRHTITTVE